MIRDIAFAGVALQRGTTVSKIENVIITLFFIKNTQKNFFLGGGGERVLKTLNKFLSYLPVSPLINLCVNDL